MKKILFLLVLVVAVITSGNQKLNAQENYEEKTYVVEQLYFFDELDYAFYQSYNAFLNGQDARSGARLKRAAYFVRMEADDAKVHNKKPILKQAERLESLADSIALGKINSSWRLRRAYARTHNIIAKDYKWRAAGFWAAEKTEDTGQAMLAAAGYLGHATKWTGKKIEKGVVGTGKAIGKAGKATGKGVTTAGVESYRGVRWLAGKMIQGIAFVPEKVGQGLQWLGKGIDKVGEEVEPEPRKDKNKK